MTKKSSKPRAVKVYSNLAQKRRTKKDKAARKKAEYLASLPKHPLKRIAYRVHPKRVAKYWFSKHGAITALKLVGVGILLAAILIGGVFAYYRKDLDSVRPGSLAERVQTTVTKYYDRNGVLLWEDKGSGDYRLTVSSDEISDYMKEATIAIEDKDFYRHSGISVTGIVRSAFNNAAGGDVQGGSTLTQQLVKQVFLADEANQRGINGIPRKIKEAILAIEVERKYTKDQILNLYLNESPYGGRRNGVESAAQTYFGVHASKLSLAQAALLASIPNSPSLYDPYTGNSEALIARQHKVLDSMAATGKITRDQADKAKKVAIMDQLKPLSDQLKDIRAPHFVLMVKQQLEKDLGTAIVGRGGLTVKTTLDYRIQKKLEQATKDMFNSYYPNAFGFTNAASTIEDVKTGQIVAMMGSRDFNYPGYGETNAATSSIQPGSTVKPLVYAKLFEDKGSDAQNFGSGSVLADDRGADSIYGAPLQNWDGQYKGAISIRQGLAWSRNVPAVKAEYINGVQPTLDYIRAMGDKSYCTIGAEAQTGLASAIGGCGTQQVQHVNAIASLARMGVYKPYSTILEVKNSQGDTLEKYTDSSKRVGTAQAAYIVADILHDHNARLGLFGTESSRLDVPGVDVASKSGTSDIGGQSRDLWTVSYSPVLAMATWLGNNDTRLLIQSDSSVPALIIQPVMEYAHKEIYAKEGKWKAGDWFKQPDGIQVINGQLYPSWYNKAQSQSNEKMTFDRVSRKKATDCTPEAAKVQITVTGVTDPVTKKKTYFAADGYDASASDDAHKCSDAKPSVNVDVSSDGKRILLNYSAGKFGLRNVTVTVNGTQIASLSPGGSGSKTLDSGQNKKDSFTVTATISDEGYYTASADARYTP
ncbi:MAG TPA: transglycosylase domain-containing protein [Patescibacteria group bacterium]|nr:transglycosylase domain-containing protein [Patescibacteria group bacterium]